MKMIGCLRKESKCVISARFLSCKQFLTTVYIGLKDIESNDISDWLENESMQLVVHSLVLQARKLWSMDQLFLVTERGFKRLYKGDFECCQMKR